MNSDLSFFFSMSGLFSQLYSSKYILSCYVVYNDFTKEESRGAAMNLHTFALSCVTHSYLTQLLVVS